MPAQKNFSIDIIDECRTMTLWVPVSSKAMNEAIPAVITLPSTISLKLKIGWESQRTISVASNVANIEKAMSSIRTIEDLT